MRFGRALLIGQPCLLVKCLSEAMNGRGIETGTCPFEQRISTCASDVDVFVTFLTCCQPDVLSLVRRRMAELRAQIPRVPAVALVENADSEAANFAGMGFSSVVLGLPSVSFAVDIIYLVMVGSRQLREFDPLESESPALAGPIEGEDREPSPASTDVCFTRRELDLLDLLRRGMQNKLMAYELGISESTVKAHLRSIMTKLKAKNRTQAVCMLAHDIERAKESLPG